MSIPATVHSKNAAAETTRAIVTSTRGVCGGEPCIRSTRIPVWVLYQARRLGASDAKILRMYPQLRPRDLRGAWRYVKANQPAIDRMIRENQEW